MDMSRLGENPDYDRLCSDYTVLCQSDAKQKQELVIALKRQGHQVAMTGDGVNDLLALREADCSIAVADGSDASRQISQVVLLESNFDHLPQVVMEGRKVIHNVTRTAQVFFIKTIYSMFVSFFCLLTNQPFPFIPIQITLVDACIEAYPSFLTILNRTFGGYAEIPSDCPLSCGAFWHCGDVMIIITSLFAPFSAVQCRTVMYLLLILISMAAVVKSCFPWSILRVFICVTMAAGTFLALALLPSLFEIVPMTSAMMIWIVSGAVMAAAVIVILEYVRKKAAPNFGHSKI